MIRVRRIAAVAFMASGLTGSVACTEATPADLQAFGAQHADLTETEVSKVLALVNTASLNVLDVDVELDQRAAKNIVAHRDGQDGVLGTADDNPFDTLAELDAISYVGPSALAKLSAFAEQNDPDPQPVGDAAVLHVANTATFTELDEGAELDRRAAENIVAYRNGADGILGTGDDDLFDTIQELDDIAYVGASALAKLAAYAQANQPATGTGCLIISEYVEAWGNYNKAVELFNCGTTAIELSDYAVCLVRNDDTTCTLTGQLSAGSLAPGDVHTTCRKDTTAFLDPMEHIVNNCDQVLAGVMTFSGDDRLVVFRDNDEDGELGAADVVTDALGLIAERPPSEYWSNKVLRRCNLTPFDGVSGGDYFYWDYFEAFSGGSAEELGMPPSYEDGCP